MWNSTGERKSLALATAVIGTLAFNTHANVDYSTGYDDVNHSEIQSNLYGTHWLTINLCDSNNEAQTNGLVGISDIISEVKTNLGLPNKDIAQIFKVTRQTLHSYAKNSDVKHAVNSLTLKRAFTLSEIIKELASKFRQSPGAMAKNYSMDGHTLLDLLSETNLNPKTIVGFANKLSLEMDKRNNKRLPMSDNALYELTRFT